MVELRKYGDRSFNDVYGLGYPYNQIHPYKQKSVKFIVDNCPPEISTVIIFGSAVKSGHFWWNDLDVCLIGENLPDNYSGKLKLKPVSHGYDFITYPSSDELDRDAESYGNIGWHIKREGVVVYESR